MNIEKIAEEWKAFKKRQRRIYERNLHSDEYHEALKLPFNMYTTDVWRHNLKLALDKDKYKDSIEGLLDWINDGRPE